MTTLAGRRVVALLGAAALLAAIAWGCSSRDDGGRGIAMVTIRHSRFDPARFTFEAGTTVKFEITNTDPIDHEFIVGDEALQDYIERTDHPEHDGSVPGQISLPPGETRSTTYTFDEPGVLLLGCHLPGHFAYGMRGTFTIAP
jgi:uncharacterized cupredoxin-like copper-binding protein